MFCAPHGEAHVLYMQYDLFFTAFMCNLTVSEIKQLSGG